jgi:outer membrane protein OmpA-like peptidoglycan-associated protein
VTPPITDSVRGDMDMDIFTAAVGYRFDTFGENSWIDVMVGQRMLGLDAKIRRVGIVNASVQNDRDIDDTVIILRPSFRFAEKWRFNPTFDYGVSGDSDTTYTLSPQIQWDFSDSFALRFGYKTVNYDFEDGVNGTASYRQLDIDTSGPFLGLGWTFPSRAKPVPVAAPVAAPAPAPKPAPPPPVVAAKCPDGDKDGVCDAADQCPNTPAGARVGPGGCDCDYVLRTHFAFDSAVLTAEDKAQLDTLIAILLNPKLNFMAGTVTGHSDNVGKPEYNLDLSKRRAQAVADYAKAKGVSFGDRFQVIGRGEADPIADNKTEDGRAQNRRVTIRRTDCGPSPNK